LLLATVRYRGVLVLGVAAGVRCLVPLLVCGAVVVSRKWESGAREAVRQSIPVDLTTSSTRRVLSVGYERLLSQTEADLPVSLAQPDTPIAPSVPRS
jgi:hypothetical protein